MVTTPVPMRRWWAHGSGCPGHGHRHSPMREACLPPRPQSKKGVSVSVLTEPALPLGAGPVPARPALWEKLKVAKKTFPRQ